MRWNILGNGDNAGTFKRGTDGKLLICNMPPFEIPRNEVFATCMVDYKMMLALANNQIKLDMYDWILGTRPRHWMEVQPAFYMKYSQNIKAFHQHVPQYAMLEGQTEAQAATNYSCGHMAVDYACRVQKATEVHIYGFDSIFDMNLKSCSDFYLPSPRDENSNVRLNGNWRPIWDGIFNEFKDVKFVLHHKHDHIKIKKPDNVEIEVYNKKKKVS